MTDRLRDSQVTLAVVYNKLEDVHETVTKMDEKVDNNSQRISCLETSMKWMMWIGGGLCSFIGGGIMWMWNKLF